MKMKNIIRTLVASTLASASALTFAAGVTDSADSVITLNLSESIQLVGVENVTITDPATGTNATGGDDFCVAGIGFSNFSITFESSDGNDDSAFSLTGATNPIPYTVGFRNATTGTYNTASPGVALTGQNRNAASCTGGDNAGFEVTIDNSAWEIADVLNGTSYTDTLTITVTTE